LSNLLMIPSTQTLLRNIRAHGHFGAEYHADHSYELNPPSYTLLRMVKTPPSGGDTIFTSQTALFDKLSPTFQKTFEALHAIHSSDVYICHSYVLSTRRLQVIQRSYVASINGGANPHRAPIATAHPLVRNSYRSSSNYFLLIITNSNQ
jgi:sulfonate dioxygenase